MEMVWRDSLPNEIALAEFALNVIFRYSTLQNHSRVIVKSSQKVFNAVLVPLAIDRKANRQNFTIISPVYI